MTKVVNPAAEVITSKPLKGEVMLIDRKGKAIIGRVTSSGSAKLKLDALGYKDQVHVEAGQELYTLTVLVDAKVLTALGLEVPEFQEVEATAPALSLVTETTAEAA